MKYLPLIGVLLLAGCQSNAPPASPCKVTVTVKTEAFGRSWTIVSEDKYAIDAVAGAIEAIGELEAGKNNLQDSSL